MSGSANAPVLTAFTAGDIVISVSGDGDGSGTYADNQASPIVLEEINPATGAEVGQMTLPETTTVVNGTTEYGVSGEYGSSSEGSLELSADGKSLVIAGYAINPATYNAGESNGANVYGNAAEAQSTSLTNQTTYKPVARAIADISYNGTVDTSTALYNVFNTNNPRSVATVDGSSFYIAGQGVSGDTTQGVFYAQDGASSATAIDNSTDARTVMIYDGQLYVSRDSKQATGANSYTSNISTYGTEPTTATPPGILAGISQTVSLAAGQGNTVNAATVPYTADLSPENYFFANADTLYIADGGNPKGNTSKHPNLGDGGLQKWTFDGTKWNLDYTLSAGLNLVPDTAASGSTGLIGLTGVTNANGTVTLYATNATLTDTGQTYLYTITDALSATTDAGEQFTVLATAAPDTNIRGVAFAPSDSTTCFAAGTGILTLRGEVPVEQLRIGDVVVTRAGDETAITWLGRWRIDLGRDAAAQKLRPVCIMAGALGHGIPYRNLRVSPDHSMFLDDVFIPAHLLINGETITQPPQGGAMDYYHVEVEPHDVIFANGAACESFLDMRASSFAKTGTIEEPRTWEDACAPIILGGPQLAAARLKLGRRAGEMAHAVRM